MTLSDIIYEKINDDYSHGKYGTFNVIIMNKNTYINATKLCGQYNKDFFNWKRLDASKELINEVNERIQAPSDLKGLNLHSKAFIIDNTSDNDYRGTYVHPLLIPHVCSWISTKFAIKVSEIVNYHLTMHLRNQNSELMKKLDDQSKELAEIKQLNMEVLGYTKHIDEDINTLIDLSIEQIEETRVASNDRINIPTNACHIENMAIVKSTDPNCKKPYHMIRGIYSYVKVTIGKLTGTRFSRVLKNNTNPWLISTVGDPSKYDYIFVKAFSNIPNARHLFRAAKEFKDPDGSKIIESSEGNDFGTLASEPDLLDWIQKVFDNRLTIKIEELDLQKAKSEFSKKIKNTKPKSKLLTSKILSL
jgi:hypothetical protein